MSEAERDVVIPLMMQVCLVFDDDDDAQDSGGGKWWLMQHDGDNDAGGWWWWLMQHDEGDDDDVDGDDSFVFLQGFQDTAQEAGCLVTGGQTVIQIKNCQNYFFNCAGDRVFE